MDFQTNAACVRGSSHVRSGKECQDALDFCVFESGGEPVVAFALSDGAGCARYSGEAARVTVGLLLRLILEQHEVRSTERADVVRWFGCAAQHLRSVLTSHLGCNAEDLLCTAILGVVWSGGGWCAQLGDGATTARIHGEWSLLSRPDGGEYAGETFFLVSEPSIDARLQFHGIPAGTDGLVAFTDGLQSLLLQPGFHPHPPILEKLLRGFDSGASPSTLEQQLAAFLNHPLVLERTHDDKSLFLLRRA